MLLFRTLFFLLILLFGSGLLARADDVGKSEALVVIRTPDVKHPEFTTVRDRLGLKVLSTFPDNTGLVVKTTLSREELAREFGPGATIIQPNPFTVSLFGGYHAGPGCQGPGDLPVQASTPKNVCRIVGQQGASTFDDPSRFPAVWIVDSGLDQAVITNKLINYQSLVDCTKDPCAVVASDEMDDRLGHGTMIAGIVGGVPNKTGAGVYGVSPNARVNVVRIFNKDASANFYDAPLRGLDWIRANVGQLVKPGDIVNVSWGAKWTASGKLRDLQGFDLVDQDVHALADLGLNVVIASGNTTPDDPVPLWYGFMTPANAGGYKSSNGGAIYAVAAIVTEAVPGSGHWSDDYWPFGAYVTSTESMSPPVVQNYVEPGVDVVSLWRSAKGVPTVNTCSGTSFAAPALAGLLVRSHDGSAIKRAAANDDPAGFGMRVGYIADNGGAACP